MSTLGPTRFVRRHEANSSVGLFRQYPRPSRAGDPTVSEANFLTAWEVTDPNGNRSQVAFDTRGVVVKWAIMGKVADSDGDTLADPTTTFEYDLFAFQDSGKPTYTKSRARVTHGDPGTEWIESYGYFGGAGQTLMVKAQAEPGLAPERDENGELVLDLNGDLCSSRRTTRWDAALSRRGAARRPADADATSTAGDRRPSPARSR
jgi:hypothetical protein